MKERIIRYRPGTDPKPKGKTDWARVDAMTEEEIEAAALSDPDAQPLTDEELAQFFRPRAIREARERLGFTPEEFARRFRIDLRSLEDWEEGRAVPESIARAYLRVIERNPEAVLDALED